MHDIDKKLKVSSFEDSYYMVYRNSANRFEYFFNVSFCEGLKAGIVVGNFSISKNIPVELMRDAILENAEDVIRSNDVVSKEMPVYMTFDGLRFSSMNSVFGRRV